jgi:hypothetical protein
VTDHLDRFQKWVERFPNPARLALLARCGALVTETDAERHFVQAIELAEALPLSSGRARTLYGEWLRRHAGAATLALTCGRRWNGSTARRVAVGGARPLGVACQRGDARKRPRYADQLTPQELHVARLVAEG